MIDIHCHILPGIDDGAKDEEASIAMAKAAVAQGIQTIIATPHHQNGSYTNTKTSILENVQALNNLLQEEGIPLTILPGQENRLFGEMVSDLQSGELLTLTNETNYLFVEFPSGSVPRYAKQMLFDLQVAGVKPIIVHPERNREIIEHPSILFDLVQRGALTQVTAASVIGKFGKNIQKFTHQLIEANLTHFIASDAHNTTSRGFCLDDAFQHVKERYGSDYHYFMLENSQLLVDGSTVNCMEPSRVKKKKILGLF